MAALVLHHAKRDLLRRRVAVADNAQLADSAGVELYLLAVCINTLEKPKDTAANKTRNARIRIRNLYYIATKHLQIPAVVAQSSPVTLVSGFEHRFPNSGFLVQELELPFE